MLNNKVDMRIPHPMHRNTAYFVNTEPAVNRVEQILPWRA